ARAGGRVHVLLGNHETMVWMHDLRYVHARETAIAQAYGVPYPRLFDIRESVLGQWLASKPAVLKLDRILFAHGGVSSDFLAYTPKAVDDTLARFLGEEWFYRWNDSSVAFKMDSAAYARRVNFLMSERSLFWFRGYVQSDSLGSELDRVLRRFGADLLVVGHTPNTLVHQKYSGRLIAAHPRTPAIEMVLLVRNGRAYKRYRMDTNGAWNPLPAKAP
ncbi:MAG: metallophosphoesterase, partial [Longimicrobiales bacterium]